MARHLLLGRRAEQQALRYLMQNGLTLIEKNYHCRQGEIDLIMQDIDTIACVEVRYRNSISFDAAIESVDFYKQTRLSKAIQHFYSHKKQYQHLTFRADLIAVKADWTLDWIKNAFEVQY